MTRGRGATGLAVMAVLACAATTVGADVAQASTVTPASSEAGRARLLDVPYLSQTEDLCGGAAVAMVLRYWGQRQVYPEDFVGLVDRSASGIRTDVLAAEVSRRGWRSFPIDAAGGASGAWARQQLARGRPIVALIEVRPNRYHYVVIVAWTGGRVVAHDPAQAPFRVIPDAEFDEAWAAAGRWALLVLPGEERPEQPERPAGPPPLLGTHELPAPGACESLVQAMVPLARDGEVADAEAGLLVATRVCPADPAAWRALAGIRFLQSRWSESSAFAERAARLDPNDEPGWDLLATSRFLDNASESALEAWNRIGRPLVDIVRVEGARRTRHPLIVDLVGLRPPTLLTAERHARAARRLEELPSASLTRLRYRPVDGGLAEIEAVVVERPLVPRGAVVLAVAAARALIQREVDFDVVSPTGSGDVWTGAWRWWEGRPRLAFGLGVPSPSWLPGIATIGGSWERSSYALPSSEGSGAVTRRGLERRRAAFGLSDWATSRIRWTVGGALDRWGNDGHLSVDGGVDLRFAGDRGALGAETGVWLPTGAGSRFGSGAVSYAWRSTLDARRPLWTVVAGLTSATAQAPLDIWPGAGIGIARRPLLRAHPLLEDGVVTGAAFGRGLAHTTLEYQHPLWRAEGGAIRLAAFSDLARAWHRVGSRRGTAHLDVGVGVRVPLPGKGGGVRADIARGVRDGGVVLSAGWLRAWPKP